MLARRRRRFAPAPSPQTYTGLAAGAHTFAVRAIDAEGLVDPTPATFAWTVGAAAGRRRPSAAARSSPRARCVTNDLLDCPGNGLVVGADGITIDLDGHTIDGIGLGAGVLNPGFDAVTITNGIVQEFDVGVQLDAAAALNIVSGMTALLNQVAGVQLDRRATATPSRDNVAQPATPTGIALLERRHRQRACAATRSSASSAATASGARRRPRQPDRRTTR